MKGLVKFRKTIMFLIKAMIISAITFGFIEVWVNYYTESLFSKNGNYLVIFSFVFVLVVFSTLYGAFRIGIHRIHEIIYSFSLAVIVTNFIMYLELSLIARHLVRVLPLLICIIYQIIIVFIGCSCANIVYFKLYSARKMLAIFGDDKTGFKLINKMSRTPERFKIEQGVNINSTTTEELKRLIDKYECVVICDIDKNIEKEIFSYCYSHSKRTYLLPSITDIIINNSYKIQISDTPVLMSRNRGLTSEQEIIKRFMDIILSIVGIIITSPLLLAIAILIKLDDGGPILYKQNRITKNGKIFNILKFRSMIVDADLKGSKNALVNDDRITKIGKIIRPFRLDELPQLINVLKGDMSMVGPRPERIENIYEHYSKFPQFELRNRVKAGITGYAQLYGKYNTNSKDKLNMDLIYIETYSLLQDIKLLVLTLKILFMRESTEGFENDENREIKVSSSRREINPEEEKK